MHIKLSLDIEVPKSEIQQTFQFIAQQSLAPMGAVLAVDGPHARNAAEVDAFPFGPPEGHCLLEVAFLDQDRSRTDSLLYNSRVPKLLIGHGGPPRTLNHVCVPMVGNRYRARWLTRVLKEATRRQWTIRVLHGEQSLLVREILRLADWFKEPEIKNAVTQWLDADAHKAMARFVAAHPETEIRSSAGSLKKLMAAEDPQSTMLLGSLAVIHLLKRHHGVKYGALLTRSGLSGYFTGRKPRL